MTHSKAQKEQHQATVVAKSDFDFMLRDEKAIVSEAKILIEQAKQLAEKLKDDTERERLLLEQRTRALAGEELQRFIDKESLERSVASFIAMSQQIAQVRHDFKSMTPWLTLLVETALRKIIGSLDSKFCLALCVRKAMGDLDLKNSISLRVHPDSYDEAEAAMAAHPQFFSAVSRAVADPHLDHERIVLEDSGGYLDISVETQIAALMSHLDTAIIGDATV